MNPGCSSFEADIRPKFTEEDIQHMNDEIGMDLGDYQTVSANADLILERLKAVDAPMPPRPRGPWPPEWIECFEDWIRRGRLP